MRILVVMKSAAGRSGARGTGGAEVVAANMFGYMARNGDEIYVATDGAIFSGLRDIAISVDEMPFEGAGFALLGARLCMTAKIYGADVIVSEGPIPVDAAAAVAARMAGIPCVVRRHVIGKDLRQPVWRQAIYEAFDAVSVAAAKKVIYLTEDARDRDRWGSRIGKSEIVWNGVDVEKFSCVERTLEMGPVLGMVAQFTPVKGWPVFLDAMDRVRERFPSVRAIAVGAGPLYEEIREEARGMGLDDRIEWTGLLDDIRPALARMSLLVLPSYREGLSQACIEAMATGLPLALTRVAGADLLVEDGVNGFVVDQGDADSVARAICRILENEEKYQGFCQASRDRAESLFSLQAPADRLRKILEETVEESD